MSNIAVFPQFQNLWVLTSALDSASTGTYPSLIDNSADLVRPFLLSPRASPSMTVPTFSVYPSLGATTLVLSTCTFLLLI